MMFEAAATFKSKDAFLKNHSRYSYALAQRLSVLIVLLSIALSTTSCGTAAQASGSQSEASQNISLAGILPGAMVNESYNAVLAVSGGNSPYVFSLKTGSLPPGISLNPVTGSFVGKPSAEGMYQFEVQVTDAPRHDQGTRTFMFIVANGNGGGGKVQISVSPTSVTLASSQAQQFTASVSGTSNTAVTWTASAGSFTSGGLYTAPAVTSATNVVVTATSQADSSKSASATVTVNPAVQQALQITTGTLSQGQQGSPYSEAFSATGGTTPYSWSISVGTIPPGTALSTNGSFGGMPTSIGTFNFTVMVTDATSKTASGNFSVTVAASTGYDGPAQLPIATVASSMADTPAPGSVVAVNAGGNLQSALNNANCGDIIQLQAGATFTGSFTVPAKNCDNNHWIWIRTSAADSSLPAEGQRLTPCYAGVASLQGRPQYSCNNPQNVMAKLMLSGNGDGPLMFQSGANHYRLIGLELTRPSGVKGQPALISMQQKGTASFIVLDRSWLHGTTQDDTRDGFEMSGTTSVAVVDSYFSDFHCTSLTGMCTDAHAVSGGTGDNQDGPYKIEDNFLEASGEAILFGGGAANLSPTDITVINNHFWKPWQWMKGNQPFVGGPDGNPFVVKNHFELKNAVRVLVEANLMENSWGGFSQTGYGILLTPKNQNTKSGENVCPLCQVTDVTIRYDHISHAGGGIQMATGLSASGKNGGGPALAGTRWSIHDVVLDDLSTNYVGPGSAFEISNSWPKNPLNTVTINHVTAFPDASSHMIIMGNSQTEAMYGLVFTNNLTVTGQYPIWNTGGGNASCAYKDVPITSIVNCFSSYTFGNNGLIGSPAKFPPSSWPSNNLFPQAASDVQFTNFNNGNDGNYELLSTSPYKSKGTDGKDLGADIVGLNQALENVQ
jgi:hypothetical protein